MHDDRWQKRKNPMIRFAWIVSSLLVLAVSASGVVGAGESGDSDTYDHRFYIVPSASLGFFGRSRGCVLRDAGCVQNDSVHPDADIGPEVAFGKRLFEYLALEGNIFYFQGDVQDGGEFSRYGGGIRGLVYPFGASMPVYGVVGYGIGEHEYDNLPAAPSSAPPLFDGSGQDSDYLDFGVGMTVPVPDHDLSLRLEYRHRASEVDTPSSGDVTFRDNIFSVGLKVPFGDKPAPPPEPKPEPTPKPKPKPKPKPEPIVLEGTNFAYDKATLRPQAEQVLDEVVTDLKQHPSIRIRIGGHTDSHGSDIYNQRLSQARAQSVADYLIAHGIDKSRIVEVKGYGEGQPVAPNKKPDGSDNPEGRAKNRRVEIHKVQ